jgi:hypothetical protein
MRIHQWGVALILVAWVLWSESEFFRSPPRMEEAFETKRECEARKAWHDKAWKSHEAAHLELGRTPSHAMKNYYSCWPDTIDPRTK